MRRLVVIALLLSLLPATSTQAAANDALSALNKLHAIGIESDTELLLNFAPAIVSQDGNLAVAISAITSKTVLSFSYLSEELQPENRALEPFAVTSRYGHWYIFGNDLDRKALRVFRLDRIAGDLKLQGRSGSYEIPSDVDVENAFAKPTGLLKATLFLRDGRGLNLRNRGLELNGGKAPVGWQEYELEYRDHERFVEEVLWYGSDVIVSRPQTLRDEVIAHLKSGVVTYG